MNIIRKLIHRWKTRLTKREEIAHMLYMGEDPNTLRRRHFTTYMCGRCSVEEYTESRHKPEK
jgi:hypothetical protein